MQTEHTHTAQEWTHYSSRPPHVCRLPQHHTHTTSDTHTNTHVAPALIFLFFLSLIKKYIYIFGSLNLLPRNTRKREQIKDKKVGTKYIFFFKIKQKSLSRSSGEDQRRNTATVKLKNQNIMERREVNTKTWYSTRLHIKNRIIKNNQHYFWELIEKGPLLWRLKYLKNSSWGMKN